MALLRELVETKRADCSVVLGASRCRITKGDGLVDEFDFICFVLDQTFFSG
jgi:hypothetical protein